MDARDENISREKMLDFLALLLHSMYYYCQFIARRIRRMIRKLSQNAQIAELMDVINDKFTKHPMLRYMALATSLSCAIPVVVFIIFGFVSIVATFAGFLFIEGTILAIGGVCMFACLAMMILLMSVMTLMFGVLYVTINKLGIILQRFEKSPRLNSSFSNGGSSFSVIQNHQD